METGITKNEIIAELSKSPHGKLEEYLPVGRRAATEQAEFLAHLLGWNRKKGQVRDSKVALPVIALTARVDPEFTGNALANMALLDPKNLVRSWDFAHSLKLGASEDRKLNEMVKRYLYSREDNWPHWERVVVAHRRSMKSLYARAKVKPQRAVFGEVLFERKYPENSTFAVVAQLADLSPLQAAAEIVGRKIHFLTAWNALGAKRKNVDLLLALIERMSPTELVTHMKDLEKAGVRQNPALRAALDQALAKAAKSSANVLKASVAADAIEDEALSQKLNALQEKQIQAAGGIDGDWLVLGDKSGSMKQSIAGARQVAALLARQVRGQVHLLFFDYGVRYINATGKTLEELEKSTRHLQADGGTNMGAALQYAIDSKLTVGGIAIVSDGGETGQPWFANRYAAYVKAMDCEPAVYFYRVPGDQDRFSGLMKTAGIDFQTFDLTSGSDFYSIPNLVPTMRTNRFSLVDEIMATPLLTLDVVLPRKESVHA